MKVTLPFFSTAFQPGVGLPVSMRCGLKHAVFWALHPAPDIVLNQMQIGHLGAAQVFDASGTLQDASLREFIQTYVNAVVDWMTQQKQLNSRASTTVER